MQFSKNKKSIYLWPLMVFYVMIISVSVVYFTLSPAQTQIKNFGEKFNGVYKFESKNKVLVDIFYSFDEFLDEDKFYLADEGALCLETDFLDKISYPKSNELNGGNCKFEDWFLWDNQKVNVSCGDLLNENNYIDNLYKYKIEKETDKLKDFFYVSGFTLSDNIKPENGNLILDYEVTNKNSDYNVESVYEFKKEINIEEYQKLVDALRFSLRDLDNKTIQQKISDCVKDTSKIECYNNIYNELFNVYFLDNNGKYKVEISENQNFNTNYINPGSSNVGNSVIGGVGIKNLANINSDYFMLNFEVKDTQINPNKNVFKFGAVLKNTLPPTPLSFNLENLENSDKIVQLRVVKPTFSAFIENYVVLYSNEDFTLNQGLEEKLNNNQIPNFITLQDCKNAPKKNNLVYRYSKEYKTTIFTISKKANFVENTAGELQINDFEGYCVEEGNDIVYRKFKEEDYSFFVYAIDKFNNYYAQDLKKSAKKIKPQNLKAIEPLFLFSHTENQVTSIDYQQDPNFKSLKKVSNLNKAYDVFYTGSLENVKNSFYLKVDKYVNSDFSHYNIIIKKKSNSNNNFLNSKQIESCIAGTDSECLYVDGKTQFTNANIDAIFTSDTYFRLASSLSGKQVVKVPNNFLVNGEEYYLLLIPVGKNDIVFGHINYIDTNGGGTFNVLPIYFKIEDKQPLHPTNSISEPNFFISKNDNKMYVDFNAKSPYSNSDISGLKIHFNKIVLNDNTQMTDVISAMQKNKAFSYGGQEFENIKSVEIDKIYPYKKSFSENLYDTIDANVPTHKVNKVFN